MQILSNYQWHFSQNWDKKITICMETQAEEALMLRLIGKDPDAGKDGRQEEKGMAEDEMVGWHH